MTIYEVSAANQNTDPNNKYFLSRENAEKYLTELQEDLIGVELGPLNIQPEIFILLTED